MQKHYIPLLLEKIKNDEFFINYIDTLDLKINISDKPIVNNNEYLKNFIKKINTKYNNKFEDFLKQSKLIISFTQ